MDFDEETEEHCVKIVNKLNQEGVKLWLPPYVNSEGKKNYAELEKLAVPFGEQLYIAKLLCFLLLDKLQSKALRNFREHNKYLSTGKAALKFRVFHEEEEEEEFMIIAIDLQMKGYDLNLKLCRKASTVPHRLKLIFRGKIVKDDLTLRDQNIKHGLHVMGVVLKMDCEALKINYDPEARGERAVSDIVLLYTKGYFKDPEHIKKLSELPVEDRKFLIGGMRLQQIAREYIKSEDFASAYALLLEAEEQFGHLEPAFLESFNNCMTLNLDIVWCCLNMQCLLLLPDAEERLQKFENDFNKTYGENLELIGAETDFHWMASILVLRLHVLQVAVLYHRKKTFKAGVVMRNAEQELRGLRMNNIVVNQLTRLGYTRTQSRIALSGRRGDFDRALRKIEKTRLEMTKKLFGLFKKGQDQQRPETPVKKQSSARDKLALYKSLISIGCPEEVCKSVLQEKKLPVPKDDEQDESADDSNDEQADSDQAGVVVKTVVTIGLHQEKAKTGFLGHKGSPDASVTDLFKRELRMSSRSYIDVDESKFKNNEEGAEASATSNIRGPARVFTLQNLQPASATEQPLLRGSYNVQYDYIHTALIPEMLFLQKYKSLLIKAKAQNLMDENDE